MIRSLGLNAIRVRENTNPFAFHYRFHSDVTKIQKKRIIFLGTPSVSAKSLQILYDSTKNDDCIYEIIGVVSQPPARAGKKMKLTSSPVHILAQELNIPNIMTPLSAKDETFLNNLSNLKPDLFITAAYGQFLPNFFLNISKYVTLNIHPSLLPLYRGAAPVQRCL